MPGEYYKTKETVEEYIKAAEGYSGIQLIEKLKNYLQPKSTLLEIGSGPGTDWEILNKSFKVMGSDNSKEFIDHLKNKHPNGEFLKLDASTLSVNESFDAVYSNKVLHHLREREITDSLKRQSEILNKGGIICHSFWRGNGSEVFKGLFVNYHQQEDLRKVISPYFEILSMEYYEEFEKDDSIILIAKKK